MGLITIDGVEYPIEVGEKVVQCYACSETNIVASVDEICYNCGTRIEGSKILFTQVED